MSILNLSTFYLVISIVVNYSIYFQRRNRSGITATKFPFFILGVVFFRNFIGPLINDGFGLYSIFEYASYRSIFLNLIVFILLIIISDRIEDFSKKNKNKQEGINPQKKYKKYLSEIEFKFSSRQPPEKIFLKYKNLIEDEFLELKINPDLISWEECFIDDQILCLVNKDNDVFAEYERLDSNDWYLFVRTNL